MIAQLDRMAADLKISRADLVRKALQGILDGQPLPPQAPMTEDEIVQRLTEKARSGSVSALRAMLTREASKDPRERSAEILRSMIEDQERRRQ